jgi:nucleoside-diphosphate-sugar epimerase
VLYIPELTNHRWAASKPPSSGDGAQRWPAVHALDAAVLFRLALEKAPAGTAWHAVSDQGDAVRS